MWCRRNYPCNFKTKQLIFQQPDENKSIPAKNVKNYSKQLSQMEPEVLRKVLKVIPDRIHTIIPGMIVLQTMIKHFGCEEIQVSPYGVREGYLLPENSQRRQNGFIQYKNRFNVEIPIINFVFYCFPLF